VPQPHTRVPRARAIAPPFLGLDAPTPVILASDPYTVEAFKERTSLSCAPLSFSDIAEGKLPHPNKFKGKRDERSPVCTLSATNLPSLQEEDVAETEPQILEMVICSFALHLVESPSELFALLWELSTKSRWLIVTAPHKKPELKAGWGWSKWDLNSWSACQISDAGGEILLERVHCRVYRSLNCH